MRVQSQVPVPFDPAQLSRAASDMLAERRRQIEVEGWTADHDNRHDRGEMADAAACYAATERVFFADHHNVGRGYEAFTTYRDAWPWADLWWKPKDRRNNLVRAAALILAEIERLDREQEEAAISKDPAHSRGTPHDL